MQFKIYDILASLIPGTFILGLMLVLFLLSPESTGENAHYIIILKDLSGVSTAIFLTLSYLIGYLIHALGSWVEPLLWVTWGGRPAEILLKNKSKRMRMVFAKETLESLLKESKIDKPVDALERYDFKLLFQIAKSKVHRSVDSAKGERLAEFSNSYIFSRNILVALVISAGLLFTHLNIENWPFIVFYGIAVVMCWIRSRDKAIYYAREILAMGYESV